MYIYLGWIHGVHIFMLRTWSKYIKVEYIMYIYLGWVHGVHISAWISDPPDDNILLLHKNYESCQIGKYLVLKIIRYFM